MNDKITKNTFLESQKCHTKGWYLHKNKAQTTPDQAEKFRIDEGVEIGKMARSLYPNGLLINAGSNFCNAEKTKQLMNDKNVDVIFEATFMHEDYIARADIMVRIDLQWHLIEVKSSSYSDDKDIQDEIDDLAYTAMIILECGIELNKMILLLVSKHYRLGMDNSHFFTDIDCTDKVNQKTSDFITSADAISGVISTKNRPEPNFIMHCKKCDFFETECIGGNIENPIFDLPRITSSAKKFDALTQDNIFCIEDIPESFALTKPQEIVRIAIANKEPIIDKIKLKMMLNEIIFPAYYLDFETVSTAIPLYQHIAPYQEIVTQYSIHKISDLDYDDIHSEFLADHTKDDRKALSEKLISDIGGEGSVIVYHAAAEKKFIKNLANAVPDLEKALLNIIDRIVDLEVIINKTYYHPAFHGSYSIKVVLPILVPEMSYKNLVIGDGQSANIIFAELARGKYTAAETVFFRKELLTYCKQDTLAMVKIHKNLISLVDGVQI